MTNEEAIKELKELDKLLDQEYEHVEADRILCKLLSSLGYEDVVEEYNKTDKWFA